MIRDERPHFKAVESAINAQIGSWSVYEYGQVPGLDGNEPPTPDMYVLLQVERRAGASPLHASAQAGRIGWRASVRAVARTANECRWLQLKIADALDEQVLDVDGDSTSPIQLESGSAPASDKGWFESLSRWTYTA